MHAQKVIMHLQRLIRVHLLCANIYYKCKRASVGHYDIICYCLTCACQAVDTLPNMGVDNNPSDSLRSKVLSK